MLRLVIAGMFCVSTQAGTHQHEITITAYHEIARQFRFWISLTQFFRAEARASLVQPRHVASHALPLPPQAQGGKTILQKQLIVHWSLTLSNQSFKFLVHWCISALVHCWCVGWEV